jgi:hypothetical protein
MAASRGHPVIDSGMSSLPLVTVDTYSEELRDESGFRGDRASRRAFDTIVRDWRDRVCAIVEHDPLPGRSDKKLSKKKLDRAMRSGSSLEAGLVHTAIEEFSVELADVIRCFLKLDDWRDTQRIVIGGGLSGSRVGAVITGRAAVLLKGAGHPILMDPIRYDPDEAALIGATQLANPRTFRGTEAMIAVDIGGSNIRAGTVDLGTSRARGLSDCRVVDFDLWRYADEKPRPKRDETVARLGAMLERLLKAAKKQRRNLAPVIGIACPGVIAPDGAILSGAQNLPGNWEKGDFNLGERLMRAIPTIDGHETQVLVHNDAVVQGLCEAPFMGEIDHWGVITIGTGLGNARFTNRATKRAPSRRSGRRVNQASLGQR